MGLVIPGFIPDTLGEIYEYTPTTQEILISIGIWATGALLYTFLLKLAIPVYTGKLRFFSKAQMVTAGDIMSRRIVSVLPDASAVDVAKLLISRHLSDAAVVDRDNKLIGTVSETEIISQEVSQDADRRASDIMTPPSAAVKEDTKIQELGKVLAEHKTNRLFVIDKDNRPVGMVSGNDILKALENIRRE
jgi:CBS domain-containing protein